MTLADTLQRNQTSATGLRTSSIKRDKSGEISNDQKDIFLQANNLQ
jgi:hypothetical protein